METPTVRRWRLPPRTPGRWAAAGAALAVLVGGAWAAVADDGSPTVRREDRTLRMDGVPIDTSYFHAGGSGKRPAVLIGHGFGGSKNDVRAQAEKLAADGYAVLTWSARGFGGSGGEISLNDPDHEVKDVSRLIDWLAERPEVQLDEEGDPRVGLTGASYGGAVSLLAAGHDERVDAVAPAITYWNLADALFPDGVFKKLWAGIFISTGGGCERFEKRLCAMYERVAVSGKPDAEAVKLLTERSPSAVADRITVPSLLLQGQSDSLFPLGHADAMQKAISANGAPVSVDWIAGGHDGGDDETGRIQSRVNAWFDRYLKEDTGAGTGPAFRVSRTGGVDSTDGAALLRGASGDAYPGLRGGGRDIAVDGGTKTFHNPAGAAPPAISAVPGVGGGLGRLSSLGIGLSLDFPGQSARFESAPLDTAVRVTGTPTVKVNVTADGGRDAVLFGKVYDVAPDGGQQVLPHQLVAPHRITPDRQGRPIELALPAVDHEFDAGHRMRLVFSATDLGYASPAEPATYTVTADGPLTVPTAPAVTTAAAALPWWTWGLPAAALVIAAALLLTARRRTAPRRRTPNSPTYRSGSPGSPRSTPSPWTGTRCVSCPSASSGARSSGSSAPTERARRPRCGC